MRDKTPEAAAARAETIKALELGAHFRLTRDDYPFKLTVRVAIDVSSLSSTEQISVYEAEQAAYRNFEKGGTNGSVQTAAQATEEVGTPLDVGGSPSASSDATAGSPPSPAADHNGCVVVQRDWALYQLYCRRGGWIAQKPGPSGVCVEMHSILNGGPLEAFFGYSLATGARLDAAKIVLSKGMSDRLIALGLTHKLPVLED